ncbi:MAG: glutamine--fructose-6-phosphate transaminase (isomerizing) [Candidatus Paceibacterota bacterium]|jgi:glucosamine--fructose-6-phosphate aminotransferase (isomerizing)
MCGIVGYVGKKQAFSILMEGIKRLEYRGYDSAGIVVIGKNGKGGCYKKKGRIENLERTISGKTITGNTGLSHTRWATHGEPSDKNAHPIWDCKKEIYLVHNGIIENAKTIKEKLQKKGHKFITETDTEILTHLIEDNFENLLEEAVKKSLRQVIGAYAIAVISKRDPEKIVFARNSSPLIVGLGDGENFIASDAAAILAHTRKVIYLNDGEIGVITDKDFSLSTLDNKKIERSANYLDWDIGQAKKSGYDHFMLKEMNEIPEVIENAIRGRIVPKDGMVKLGGLELVEDRLKKIKRIIILGMGTALLAGKVGKYMIEEYAEIPVEVENASEFRYRKSILNEDTAILAISQSGETIDTLLAIREAKRRGVLTLGIINVVGSTIARETDAGIYNHAGPEIGVASTKAFVSQLVVLALLTVFLGRQRNMSLVMGRRIIDELGKLSELAENVLDKKNTIKSLAKKYCHYNDFFYLGRKYNFPVAEEGALKLKEISYIHAEGYSAGEMKHGPIALIDENFPTFFLAPKDSVYEKIVSAMEEIKARKGPFLAIATEGDKKIQSITKDIIYIPKTLEMLTPILSVIPLQLFAYYVAVLRGCDIDKPRNLAKSVTVE